MAVESQQQQHRTQVPTPVEGETPRRPSATAPSGWSRLVTRAEELSKWLRIGMRVKRWLVVALLGIGVMVAGVNLMFLMQLADLGDELNRLLYRAFGFGLGEVGLLRRFTYQVIIGVPTAVLGLLIFVYGVRNMLVSVTSAVVPTGNQPIADVIWRRRQLAHGARIVVIGGGTGLSTLLRGLKEYTSNITAVVTVTDDGGSSGRLQREFNMLPPGDIRNCLVALADAEPLMQELFQYRFKANGKEPNANGDTGLMGHSFGNLLIAAMLHITGDFEEAIRQTSRVLAIRGRVLPSTTHQVGLQAELDDGTIVHGESSITAHGGRVKRVMLTDPEAPPLDEALDAIRTADAIVIGPGSVYTSVVPNFLVKGVAEAVAESPAVKIYVCNVMTQRGETTDFTASDHVAAVFEQAGVPVFDYVLVNVREPNEALRERYAGAGSQWVAPDVEKIRLLGLRPITGDFISQSSVVRHDPDRLAEEIVRLVNRRVRPLLWALDRRDPGSGWW
jgi:uncharacterized cofD-like protein